MDKENVKKELARIDSILANSYNEGEAITDYTGNGTACYQYTNALTGETCETTDYLQFKRSKKILTHEEYVKLYNEKKRLQSILNYGRFINNNLRDCLLNRNWEELEQRLGYSIEEVLNKCNIIWCGDYCDGYGISFAEENYLMKIQRVFPLRILELVNVIGPYIEYLSEEMRRLINPIFGIFKELLGEENQKSKKVIYSAFSRDNYEIGEFYPLYGHNTSKNLKVIECLEFEHIQLEHFLERSNNDHYFVIKRINDLLNIIKEEEIYERLILAYQELQNKSIIVDFPNAVITPRSTLGNSKDIKSLTYIKR